MSFPIMPTTVPWSLIKKGFAKTPVFNNQRFRTAANRGTVIAQYMPFATWNFNLDLNYVKGGEMVQNSVLQSFLSVFMQCGAGYFLYPCPNDITIPLANGVMINGNPAAGGYMQSVVGDGSTTVFQLARSIGSAYDIIQNINGSLAQVKVGGSPTSAYSITSKGVVTFNSAPANNAVIQWTGDKYDLCLFEEDTLNDLSRVAFNGVDSGGLWTCSSVKFGSVFLS